MVPTLVVLGVILMGMSYKDMAIIGVYSRLLVLVILDGGADSCGVWWVPVSGF